MKTADRWKQRDQEENVASSTSATLTSAGIKEGQDGIRVLFRSPEPDDAALGLVLDAWTKAVADHSPWQCNLRSDTSARWQGRLASGETRQGGTTAPIPRPILVYHHDILLKKLIPHTDITLACDPGDPDTVWGWVCSDLHCLHFIYVKNAFRGFGIGRLLLEETGLLLEKKIRISHRTPALYSHWPGVHFMWNPYRMMIWN